MRNALMILTLILFAHTAMAAMDYREVFKESGKFTVTDGEDIYRENCLGCHMAEGKGVHTGAGMYPALANNASAAMPEYTAFVVMHGLRGMPSFEPDFTDAQILEIANYVSTSFGNKPQGKLSEADVKGIRPETPVEYIEY